LTLTRFFNFRKMWDNNGGKNNERKKKTQIC
jgi:hypothetical protein